MCAKPNTILAFLLRKRVDQDRSREPKRETKLNGTQNAAKYSFLLSQSLNYIIESTKDFPFFKISQRRRLIWPSSLFICSLEITSPSQAKTFYLITLSYELRMPLSSFINRSM